MALNNGVTSIIVFFFILATFRGEACNIPSVDKKANPKCPPGCANVYVKAHMELTFVRCKQFVQNELVRRLEDPDLIAKDRVCLKSCFAGYSAAIASVTKGIADVSAALYPKAVEDVVAFTVAIAPCMTCSAVLTFKDPEIREFQTWAKNSAVDLRNKLKTCTNQ